MTGVGGHGMACKKVNTNYISGPGMIIGVVDANRECNLSWVKDGWIYRFFPAPAVG